MSFAAHFDGDSGLLNDADDVSVMMSLRRMLELHCDALER